MMKQIYLFALLPALMMMGCSQNGDESTDAPVNTYPEDGGIRVTTTMNETVKDRGAGDVTDFTGTEFQLFIDPVEALVNGKDVNADYHYQLKVEKSASGNWDQFSGTYGTSTTSPLGDKIPLWAGPRVQTEVKAYAHYQGGVSPFPLLDQSTAELSGAVDLLYFYKSLLPGTGLDSDKKLVIGFTHRLSQLNIILNFGSEFNRVDGKTMDDGLIQSVGIYEIQNEYTFDVTTAPSTDGDGAFVYPVPVAAGSIYRLTDLTSDPTSIAHITPYIYRAFTQGLNPTITYTALVVPQEVKAGTHLVVITLYPMTADGSADTAGAIRNFIYTIPAAKSITLESGKAYSLTLTVGKDQITGGILTPEAWQTGSDDTIITD